MGGKSIGGAMPRVLGLIPGGTPPFFSGANFKRDTLEMKTVLGLI